MEELVMLKKRPFLSFFHQKDKKLATHAEHAAVCVSVCRCYIAWCVCIDEYGAHL